MVHEEASPKQALPLDHQRETGLPTATADTSVHSLVVCGGLVRYWKRLKVIFLHHYHHLLHGPRVENQSSVRQNTAGFSKTLDKPWQGLHLDNTADLNLQPDWRKTVNWFLMEIISIMQDFKRIETKYFCHGPWKSLSFSSVIFLDRMAFCVHVYINS